MLIKTKSNGVQVTHPNGRVDFYSREKILKLKSNAQKQMQETQHIVNHYTSLISDIDMKADNRS